MNIKSLPKEGSMWLHKNGHVYTVIMNTNIGSEREDYPPTVVYKNEDGVAYSKPLETFFRSRIPYVIKDIPNNNVQHLLGRVLVDAERENDKGEYDEGR